VQTHRSVKTKLTTTTPFKFPKKTCNAYDLKSICSNYLELLERFFVSRGLGNFESVEFYCLGQRSAFSNDSNISGLNIPKARGQVNRDVLVPLLESVVFLDVMQIVPEKRKKLFILHILLKTKGNLTF